MIQGIQVFGAYSQLYNNVRVYVNGWDNGFSHYLTVKGLWKRPRDIIGKEDIFSSQRHALQVLKRTEKNLRLDERYHEGRHGFTYRFKDRPHS